MYMNLRFKNVLITIIVVIVVCVYVKCKMYDISSA